MSSSKDNYYMQIARQVASRATCNRRFVGAVVVVNDRIVSTGYNGSPSGLPHCLDVGCDLENGHCVRTVHAEENALVHAGGQAVKGGTLYTTASPCRRCMGLIINAGIVRVVYAEMYADPAHKGDRGAWAVVVAKQLGIEMVWVK